MKIATTVFFLAGCLAFGYFGSQTIGTVKTSITALGLIVAGASVGAYKYANNQNS